MTNVIIKQYYKKNKILDKKIKICLKNGDFGFSIPKLNENSILITIELENRIISFIQYWILENKDIFINGVYTIPDYRRQGLSTILHNKILNSYNSNFFATPLTNEYKQLSSKMKINSEPI